MKSKEKTCCCLSYEIGVTPCQCGCHREAPDVWKKEKESQEWMEECMKEPTPQKECEHIWDEEEYQPRCHICKKLMREDSPQPEPKTEQLKKHLKKRGFPSHLK